MGDNATVKGKGDLEHTGAVFIGWSTSATSLVTTSAAVPSTLYQPNDPITVTGAITLYAVWAEDVNGPNGTSDGVPDYLEYGITYSNNGSTGGAAPVDPNIYKTGDNITIKDEGSLVKTDYTFIGWSESIEALVTSQSQEDAISLIDPGSTMQVGTSPITLYPVWAADDDNNGIPNYKQIKITYDKGMGTTATGFPQIKPAVKNSTITLTKQGGSYSGYVLIGWSTTKIALLTTNALYTLNKSKILSLGDSYDIGTSDVTLYAVWGKDANNDGKVDFDSSIGSQSGTQNAQTKQKDLLEPNVINLRKFEVPDRLPNWDDNYDKPADNDDIYYTGCTYRQFGYDVSSYSPLYRLPESVLSLWGGFENTFAEIGTPMTLVFEYGGVLKDKSIIGGKDQKPLDKIEITAAMIAANPGPSGGYPIQELLDKYPFTIKEDAITEDGVGIVKIYFQDPSGNYPALDIANFPPGLSPSPGPTGFKWPKPFIDPETGDYSDVLTFTFNVYNKPVFKDSIIRQYADPNGYLHDLEVISGTPLKYMMRSIQERRWIQADLPLTADEIFVMDDAGSICLREMDENIGVSANTKDYYKSDRYAYDAHGNRDGSNAQVWIETFVLDSFFRADYLPFEIAHSSSFDPAWGPTGHPSTYISIFFGTGGCNSFADIYALEYQEYYNVSILLGFDPVESDFQAQNWAMSAVIAYFEQAVYSTDGGVTGGLYSYTYVTPPLIPPSPGSIGDNSIATSWGGHVVDSILTARYGSMMIAASDPDVGLIAIYKLFGEKFFNDYLPNPSRCRETFCLEFDSIIIPIPQRWVEITPYSGVTSNPVAGEQHYVNGHDDFKFTLTFPDGDPLKVMALGYYSGINKEITGTDLGGGKFEYVIRQVTEPWTVTIVPEPASGGVGLEQIEGYNVWSYQNKLYIAAEAAVTVNIYSINGMLIKQPKVSAGLTTITLDRGVYIVQLNAKRYKVIIK
jgi:hypothetical protein